MAKEYKGYAKEVVEEVLELSEFSELRITSLRNDANELQGVDIRQWYCTQKDPVKKPTQKGVRLSVENMHKLIDVLSELV